MDLYDIPIVDLLLDVNNPRHLPVETQELEIAALVKDDYIKNLAADIAMNGLSPAEQPIVIKDENSGKYVVLEGNRRVCALMLLHEPTLAPIGLRSHFAHMNKSNVPISITCAIVKKKEEAKPWIERRHSGLLGGIGLRNWSTEQKARANEVYAKADPNLLSLALFEYADKHLYLDCTNASITTATRFVGNTKFRKTLCIRSKRTTKLVRISCSHEHFEKILYRFLTDLLANEKEIGVHSRANSNDVENYANRLIKDGLAPISLDKSTRLDTRPSALVRFEPEEEISFLSGGIDQGTESDSAPENESDNKSEGHGATNSQSDIHVNGGAKKSTGNTDNTEEPTGFSENGVDPADLSDLDLSHTKNNQIPASNEIKKRLNNLSDPKLSSLYKSICTISTNQHASILYSGVWMFFEAMASQYGGYDKGLESFLKQVINNIFSDKKTKDDQKAAAYHIAQYVNCIKHSGKYYADTAGQLAIDVETIEPTILKMLDKLIEKKG